MLLTPVVKHWVTHMVRTLINTGLQPGDQARRLEQETVSTVSIRQRILSTLKRVLKKSVRVISWIAHRLC
jgi:hypothetical protein